MKSDVFNVFWDRLQFNTVRAAFNLAIAEHDNELISEIEKKVKIAEECSLHITAEAYTEIINLIKET